MFSKYLELTKPKVTLLNLLVGLTCFFIASYPSLDLAKFIVFGFTGYLAAGGCGVLNSVYDQDIDRLMERTSKRAIPAGHISQKKALLLGITMLTGGFALAYFVFNPLTTLMLVLGALFYLPVYTIWLKRKSPWNVVIGGFAGCFAALSGWTAAVNALSIMPFLVAILDFLWTPGHLWGLAIKKNKEYLKAHIPMLPVEVGMIRASQITFWLNLVVVAFSFSFYFLSLAGSLYLITALAAGIFFLSVSRGLIMSPSETQGRKAFLVSMPYLAVLMIALVLDSVLMI